MAFCRIRSVWNPLNIYSEGHPTVCLLSRFLSAFFFYCFVSVVLADGVALRFGQLGSHHTFASCSWGTSWNSRRTSHHQLPHFCYFASWLFSLWTRSSLNIDFYCRKTGIHFSYDITNMYSWLAMNYSRLKATLAFKERFKKPFPRRIFFQRTARL